MFVLLTRKRKNTHLKTELRLKLHGFIFFLCGLIVLEPPSQEGSFKCQWEQK